MNWMKIKEKFPKAYFKWELFTNPDPRYANAMETGMHRMISGSLYYFFDEEKIFIGLEPTDTKGFEINSNTVKYGFHVQIQIGSEFEDLFSERKEGNWLPDKLLTWAKENYIDRKEAETAAFIKAFEILENNLTT